VSKKPIILITGASQGIGAAIAKTFSKEVSGCRLVLVARSEKNLATVARHCTQLGAGLAETFPCDVSDAASVEAMAAAVTKRFGVLDVLINNAGVFRGAPLVEMSVKDFDQIVAANLRSVFLVSRAFAPGMAKRGRGDIFNMSSIAGLNAYPNGAAYCAAKFGVTGLTKVMRMELKDQGVRVTVVHPGATVSPSWKGSGIAAARMMPPEDVARAFVDIYRMSRRTVVEEIVLRPQHGDV
jgi:NADP-dependent 3-hydroxy acid dehydrogenase YdfG